MWKDIWKGTPALLLFPVLAEDDMTDESTLNGAIGTVSYKYAGHTPLLVHMSGAQPIFFPSDNNLMLTSKISPSTANRVRIAINSQFKIII